MKNLPHLWAGQDAFAFLWRRTYTEQQVLSPLLIVVCCCLLDRSSRCRSFEEKTLDISRGTWPMMVSSFHTATTNGSWSLSLSCGGGGGLTFVDEEKYIFENKPPPQSRSCLLLKKGWGLIYFREDTVLLITISLTVPWHTSKMTIVNSPHIQVLVFPWKRKIRSLVMIRGYIHIQSFWLLHSSGSSVMEIGPAGHAERIMTAVCRPHCIKSLFYY